jgi:hypothetical protein
VVAIIVEDKIIIVFYHIGVGFFTVDEDGILPVDGNGIAFVVFYEAFVKGDVFYG